jgi:hypothetical protein
MLAVRPLTLPNPTYYLPGVHRFVVVAEGRPVIRGVELVNYVMERAAVGNSGAVPGDGPSRADPDDDGPHRA